MKNEKWYSFKEKVLYKLDRFYSRGTISLVFSLFLFATVAVFFIGFIISIFHESDLPFTRLVWISFMQTLDPGNLSWEQGTTFYMVMMTTSTLVGIFITSILISILSTGFIKRLELLEEGKSRVIEKNHTLILGWNNNVPVMISELIEKVGNKKQVIIILTRLPIKELKDKVFEYRDDFLKTRIIFRSGNIEDENALRKCSVKKAKSIIIAERDDFMTIKTVFALSSILEEDRHKDLTISTVIYDKKNIHALNSISDRLPFQAIHLKDMMTKIIAQSSVVTGLSHVYGELFDYDAQEIYFYSSEKVVGRTFLDAMKIVKDSCVIGIVKGDRPILNPEWDYIVKESDELIVISENQTSTIITNKVGEADEEAIVSTKRKSSLMKRNVLVVGYNNKTIGVIKEILKYSLKESRFLVLVDNANVKRDLLASFKDIVDFDIICEVVDLASKGTYDNIYNDEFTSIILQSKDEIKEQDQHNADYKTIIALIHIRNIQEVSGKHIPIIIEIQEARNINAIQHVKADDFVVSELIASKMLAQICESKKSLYVFNELLDSNNNEIYLKPVTDYIDIKKEVNFFTLIEAGARVNEVVIGYKKSVLRGKEGVKLNPPEAQMIKFTNEDYLIVLSED